MFIGTVLLLSIGFFIGYTSFIPIQKARVRQRTGQSEETHEGKTTEYPGGKAPDVVSETLRGETWHLTDHDDKVVVVVFWSILCGSCVEALPAYNHLHEKYADNENFLLIGVHRYPERDVVSCYISAKEIAWPQLYETGDTFETGFFTGMHVRRTPTIYIIDKQGTVSGSYQDVNEVEKALQGFLS
jgi:thiol-disulfide isomerase/thioredoxin